MINYYRILQLEDYSDVSVVRRQYRKLAKLYHPDVNKDNPEAEEIIKIINKAHTTLTDPKEKSKYDELLKSAYILEQFKVTRSAEDDLEARKERVREFIRQKIREEIREFEASLRSFPAIFRYGLGLLAALTGLQLVYSNWYVNLSYSNYSVIVLGYLIYLTSFAFIFQFYDRHHWYLSQVKRKKRAKSRFNPVVLFFLILMAGPVMTWSLNEVRKNYHLSHYRSIAVGKVLYLSEGNRVRYQFRDANGNQVIKSQFIWNADEKVTVNEIVYIAYSSADPGISKILTIDPD